MFLKEKIKSDYPYFILFSAAIILLIKSFFGFCWSDETFYFSTTYRFYQGDSLFMHDWFPTQLSSIMLLPLFSLFMEIVGSTTGIILYFRICFVVLSFICSIVIYRIIKYAYPTWVALICSLLYLFYTHLNIATLSYYTMSVAFFLLSMLLIYHFYQTKKTCFLVMSGISFALCVLALPTMTVAYILVLSIVIILLLTCRFLPLPVWFKNFAHDSKATKVCLYTFIGICIPAFIFIIFLLTNVPLSDFIQAIPYVLSDEEHGTSLIYPLKKFFISINEVYGYAAYLGYLIVFITAILALLNSFGFRISRRLKLLLGYTDIILFIPYFIFSIGHTGYIQTAVCLFALPLFFLTDKKNWTAFFLLYVSGMLFSLVYSYSSNGYLYVLSMGHSIAAIGSILLIYDFKQDLSADHISISDNFVFILSLLCTCVLLVTLMQTITLRFINIYRDAPLSELTEEIESGPAKGLYTTPAHKELYHTVYETIQENCQASNLSTKNTEDSIFFTKLLPWGYLCTDLKCGSPTSWRTKFNSNRLADYYTLNPDRYPDIILVLDEQYGSYDTCGDVIADPKPNTNEIGGFLLDYVTDHHYEIIDAACGTIYKKP